MGTWCKLHTPATLPAAAIGSQIRNGLSNPVLRGAHYTDWAIQTAVLLGAIACFTAKFTPRLLFVPFQGSALSGGGSTGVTTCSMQQSFTSATQILPISCKAAPHYVLTTTHHFSVLNHITPVHTYACAFYLWHLNFNISVPSTNFF